MVKAGIDQDALIALISQAGARQGELVRKATCEATLRALQGRELTLENIRRVLKSAAAASAAGAARNAAAPGVVEGLLEKAVEGMDAALLKAVQANQTALRQFMDLGVSLQDRHLKAALDNLARTEDVFIAAVSKGVEASGTTLQVPWQHVLEGMRQHGTAAGQQAAQVVTQLAEQSRAALRSGRAASVRSAQAMMESYAALVSGVLLGMSEAISPPSHAPRAGRRAPPR